VTLLYNFIMAGVDLAVLVVARRGRTVWAWGAGMACAGIAACLLAAALGEDHFGVFRLLAWGLFLHAVVLLTGSAVIWWPARRVLAAGKKGDRSEWQCRHDGDGICAETVLPSAGDFW
jgi:hypothetical protein